MAEMRWTGANFYQVEAKIRGNWVPVKGRTYVCCTGWFRQMFNQLRLASGQRIRRVGDARTYPGVPAYTYSALRKRIEPALNNW